MDSGAGVADLSRVLVADEIARARNDRWSGVLALNQGEVSKGLYFLEGDVVFAASTVEEDRLGRPAVAPQERHGAGRAEVDAQFHADPSPIRPIIEVGRPWPCQVTTRAVRWWRGSAGSRG